MNEHERLWAEAVRELRAIPPHRMTEFLRRHIEAMEAAEAKRPSLRLIQGGKP